MPQPKKSGSSPRRSGTQKPTAAKRKPATSRRRPAAPKAKPASRPRSSARSADAATQRNAASVRDALARGVIITGELIQEALDDVVRRGHMTREVAEDLSQSLLETGRKQTEDVLADLEQLLGRGRATVEKSAGRTRSRTRAGVESAAAAARKAPGTDRALREVDRVRRAVGVGGSFPITGYDDLTAAQVSDRLDDLSSAQLRKVRDHERRNANRKSVLGAIERKLA